MTFARYKGGGGEGNFSKGKTYIVMPAGSDAVNTKDICVWDDELDVVHVNSEVDRRFEFCEQAYGVILEPCMDYEAGFVVVVVDVSHDLTMYSIQTPEGPRMICAHMIELIDWRTLKPGIELQCLETHWWERVERVDENMWVQMDGGIDLHPLINYRFSVTNGEIDRIRMARCINAKGAESLVEGNMYRVRQEFGSSCLIDIDAGVRDYDAARFEFI
jgi:hypothetical protein